MELDLVCGKINVNTDGRHIRRTYIDRETLAKCSGRSLIEVDAIIDNAVNKMNHCFASLEVDVLTALKERFEKRNSSKIF